MNKQQKLAEMLMSGVNKTDVELAKTLKSSAGSVRAMISRLRYEGGFNILKRLDRKRGVVSKAKYCFVKTGDYTLPATGRPSHVNAIDVQ
jgi:transcription initiation factor IIE alpha subunit